MGRQVGLSCNGVEPADSNPNSDSDSEAESVLTAPSNARIRTAGTPRHLRGAAERLRP